MDSPFDEDQDGFFDAANPDCQDTYPAKLDCDDADREVHPGQVEVECNSIDDDCDATTLDQVDGDGDGASACSDDCDDGDAQINPAADEVCNGIDDNCNGQVDEQAVDADVWYRDADGDQYGDPYETQEGCSAPAGYVARADDCNDQNSAQNPGLSEQCDGIDNDCDGVVDPDCPVDADDDGYTDEVDCDDHDAAVHPGAAEVCDGVDNDCNGATVEDCGTDADGDGYSTDTDCDDGDGEVHPGADELCDGLDQDCDGTIDEGFDADGDGWNACDECDDADAAVNPGAGEGCNGADDDCDGLVDEGCLGVDGDGDGFPAETDCDDGDALVHPGAAEVCNGIDDNCEGGIDDGLSFSDWHLDADSDGHGDTAITATTCNGAPVGYVGPGDDCDDGADWNFPGNAEVCDGLDNDCSGTVDNGLDFSTWYPDGDGDGYGNSVGAVTTCDGAPPDHIGNGTDCDDTAPGVHPGATELCNGLDDNCDLAVDEGLDSDADGTTSCAGDCNDGDATVAPGAPELCDAVDNDCNDVIDDGVVDLDYFFDGDFDGYGAGSPTEACVAPGPGYVLDGTDCDDSSSSVHPGATEVCNALDDDCDIAIDEGFDSDGDGWTVCEGDCNDGNAFIRPDATETCDGVDQDCDDAVDEGFDADGDTWTICEGDCNDGNASIKPGATETCDGVDQDCDGVIDEGFDADGDSWTTCEGDCNDGNAFIRPGATETCDGVDQDCDDTVDEGFDADGDGYKTCGASPDCDDDDAWVHPAAAEVCDGFDQDCDGTADEGFDTDADTWTTCDGDCADLDGTIHPEAVEICDDVDQDCDEFVDEGFDTDGDGWTTCEGDCVDSDGAIHPEATEVCDGVDQDCDDAVDEGFDTDGDGWTTCESDCDDAAAAVHPEATESCDGIDEDCDGVVDEGFDEDGDGFKPCGANADCDDNEVDVRPGADEVCDGIDNDCDGTVDNQPLWHNPFAYDVACADAILIGEDAGRNAGATVAGAGDANGDGYGDVIVGANVRSYLVSGPTYGTWDLVESDAILMGEVDDALAPQAVASAGDVNGDGFSDLLVGEYSQDIGETDAGAAYLLLGPVSGIIDLSAADARFNGEVAGDTAGFSVSSAGDVDGDGFDDILIGAPCLSCADVGGSYGKAYLVLGPVIGDLDLASADARFYSGGPAVEHLGYSVAGVGDVNADGYDDLLVGQPDHYGYSGGAARLFLGPVSGDVIDWSADATLVDTYGNDRAGFSVAGAGDVDADGYDDLLIATAGTGNNVNYPGFACLVKGPVTGTLDLSGADAWFYRYHASPQEVSVAGAGDVDGDGYDDVLIGSWEEDSGTGTAFLVRGPMTEQVDLGTSADTEFAAQAAADGLGRSVAGAGDLNGDGYSDLLIGAWRNDYGGTNAGAAYVIYGGFR